MGCNLCTCMISFHVKLEEWHLFLWIGLSCLVHRLVNTDINYQMWINTAYVTLPRRIYGRACKRLYRSYELIHMSVKNIYGIVDEGFTNTQYLLHRHICVQEVEITAASQHVAVFPQQGPSTGAVPPQRGPSTRMFSHCRAPAPECSPAVWQQNWDVSLQQGPSIWMFYAVGPRHWNAPPLQDSSTGMFPKAGPQHWNVSLQQDPSTGMSPQ